MKSILLLTCVFYQIHYVHEGDSEKENFDILNAVAEELQIQCLDKKQHKKIFTTNKKKNKNNFV